MPTRQRGRTSRRRRRPSPRGGAGTPTAPRHDTPTGEIRREQHALDVVGVIALLEEGERDLPGAPPRSCERRLGELRLRPFGVRDLEVRRQAAHVAAVDRRQVAADGDRAPPVVAREVELRQPRECPDDRRAVAVALAETERLRRVGDGQLQAGGRLVEPRRQVAEQQHGCRPERREPERLDVERAGIVAQRVEQRIGPGCDRERGGHRFLPARRRAAGEVKVPQSVKNCLPWVNGGPGTRRGSGAHPPREGARRR